MWFAHVRSKCQLLLPCPCWRDVIFVDRILPFILFCCCCYMLKKCKSNRNESTSLFTCFTSQTSMKVLPKACIKKMELKHKLIFMQKLVEDILSFFRNIHSHEMFFIGNSIVAYQVKLLPAIWHPMWALFWVLAVILQSSSLQGNQCK